MMYSMNDSHIAMIRHEHTRSISAENPTGAKGNGGKAASHLGPGRKGRGYISLPAGHTTTLAEIQGPGEIRHIWLTVTENTEKGPYVLRDLILRCYWDDEDIPSVEVPLGDFFLCGFAARATINSQLIAVNPSGGMNCYIPMPFARSARVTLESQHMQDIEAFFFQIDYALFDKLPENAAYLHAQWRRTKITTLREDYSIVDGIKGEGHYLGTFLALTPLERYWYGEGEVKFYIDGDHEWPTICGTGLEDYFGGAWGFVEEREGVTREWTYSTPYLGHPYMNDPAACSNNSFRDLFFPQHSFYRWHVPDPIRFTEDLRVTIQQIGVNDHQGLFERQDDLSSVAYWYQREPHARFPQLPPAADRWPR